MKAAMDKVDEAYLNEILRMGGETEDTKSNDVKVRDDGTTIEDILVCILLAAVHICTDICMRTV